MNRRKNAADNSETAGQSKPFERATPSQLRARLRQEREQLNDLHDRLGNLTDRLDDMHRELEERDDSRLRKWYIFAAICAVAGFIFIILPGIFLSVLGVSMLVFALWFAGRYISERHHVEGYFKRLALRINEYTAQETRLNEQIARHQQDIDRIEELLNTK